MNQGWKYVFLSPKHMNLSVIHINLSLIYVNYSKNCPIQGVNHPILREN